MQFIVKILRYYHTLRHLKIRQFYYRLFYLINKNDAPKVIKIKTKVRAFDNLQQNISWLSHSQTKYSKGTIRLNDKKFNTSNSWTPSDATYLEKYIINYHSYLNLKISGENENSSNSDSLMEWIEDCSASDKTRWEPYPTSIRLINWVKAALVKSIAPEIANDYLLFQARHLYRRLEFHLGGNHLLTNAKALIFVGLYFDSTETNKYYDRGLSILLSELPIQQLESGFNFEFSPMYHALFVEDLLDLFQLSMLYKKLSLDLVNIDLESRIIKAINIMELLTAPDGTVIRFNDSIDGVAPSISELHSYAKQLGINFNKINLINNSLNDINGHFRAKFNNWTLFFDAAEIGPTELPGHAHADTLCTEIFYLKIPIIRNIGTSCYGLDDRRFFERGSSAHSSPTYKGLNSSDVWSGFRVGKRAHILKKQGIINNQLITLSATHNGYSTFSNQLEISRNITINSNSIAIKDSINELHSELISYYHFAPNVIIRETLESNSFQLSTPEATFSLNLTNAFGSLEDTAYAVGFHKYETSKTLVVASKLKDMTIEIKRI